MTCEHHISSESTVYVHICNDNKIICSELMRCSQASTPVVFAYEHLALPQASVKTDQGQEAWKLVQIVRQ